MQGVASRHRPQARPGGDRTGRCRPDGEHEPAEHRADHRSGRTEVGILRIDIADHLCGDDDRQRPQSGRHQRPRQATNGAPRSTSASATPMPAPVSTPSRPGSPCRSRSRPRRRPPRARQPSRPPSHLSKPADAAPDTRSASDCTPPRTAAGGEATDDGSGCAVDRSGHALGGQTGQRERDERERPPSPHPCVELVHDLPHLSLFTLYT